MSTTDFVIGLVCGAVVLFAVQFIWHRLAGNALAKKYGDFATEAASLLEETKTLASEVETARRQRDEHFAAIEGIIAERDKWKNLYFQQASEHSNAQQLLMEQTMKIARQYKRETKKDFRLNPAIEALVTEFSGRHPRAASDG